jgi:hypothetical protein
MKTRKQFERFSLVFGLIMAVFPNDVRAATVFPVAINPGVELSFGLASAGTNCLVGIQGDEIAHYNITAQLIESSGPLIGPRIKVGRTGGIPDVAFDGANYLLVWSDDANDSNDDIYAQRVSPTGALVGGPIAVCTDPSQQHLDGLKSVAFGSGMYLIVYRDNRTGNNGIYAQLLSSSGVVFGSEITVSADALAALEPTVAFDGSNFLVVWQKRTSAPQEQYDTDGVFISPAGSKGTPFVISQTTSARYNPLSLVFNGTNYLVAWNRDVGAGYPAPSNFDIYGRFVSPGGSFPGNEIALVTGTNDQGFPCLAFDRANYLLSWREGSPASTNGAVKFQLFNAAAQPIGPPFTPFAWQGTNYPLWAAALFDGTRFVAIATLGNVITDFSFASGDVYSTAIPKSTAPPRLEAVGPPEGAQFPLRLAGTPGVNYVIQAVTNLGLTSWTALVTNSPTNGTFDFIDTQATNRGRFYRAAKP